MFLHGINFLLLAGALLFGTHAHGQYMVTPATDRSAEGPYQRIEKALDDDEVLEALACFALLTEDTPNDVGSKLAKALAMALLGHEPDAVRTLHEVLDAWPQWAATRMTMARSGDLGPQLPSLLAAVQRAIDQRHGTEPGTLPEAPEIQRLSRVEAPAARP